MFKWILKKSCNIGLIACPTFALFYFKNVIFDRIYCEKNDIKKNDAFERSKNHVEISNKENIKFISGNGNKLLAEEIAECLGSKLMKANVSRFADGEIFIQLFETVRGKEVFILQSTCNPVNENLMELILLIAAAKRASAEKITAVIPYFGYGRQDRKSSLSAPVSAKDVSTILEGAGLERLLSIDIHCPQIQGFFSPQVEVKNLDGTIIGVNYFIEHSELFKDSNKIAVVSPDAGGVFRAKIFYGRLKRNAFPNIKMAILIPQRSLLNSSNKKIRLIGNVENHTCIIVDDMINSASTICEAAKCLKENGASNVYVFSTHGVFIENAFELIKGSRIDKILVTNTIPRKPDCPPKIEYLSSAVLIAEAIRRLYQNEELSDLF